MTFFFSPEVTLAFLQNELLVSFSTMPSLISYWYIVLLCCILWTDGLKPFSFRTSLCWTYMCAFTASRSGKMEGHSVGGPRWQVLRYSGRQDFPPLLARIWMNGDGDGRRCFSVAGDVPQSTLLWHQRTHSLGCHVGR